MVLLVAIVLSLIVGFATGGSLDGVRQIGRIRFLPLVVLALVVQFFLFTPYLGEEPWVHDYGPYIHIVTILTSLFVLLANLRIPGMPIIALGAGLNALVIIANGGFMPSPTDALRESGQYADVEVTPEEKATDDYSFTNSTIQNDDTNLAFLGDVIPIPDRIPLSNVISIGDILIDIGAVVAIISVMHYRRGQDDEDEDDQHAFAQQTESA